ncbi:two-partner secretion domain-containing protein [Pseudomonas lopnurensis]|uniref:two-partner secretion domain-containing protein n=1 Tax=Pseudomonas lopnurensis TaxID=1477517 RepID=UPI00187AEB00|nr:filamentous hemagglutinin N-terminal domain-containing protein [Pseudomonas lopnurensis]MBE7376414.1 filamentous hemagglutinin N-terminal domain-containing protein [Pseudomonas lopnurensis]
MARKQKSSKQSVIKAISVSVIGASSSIALAAPTGGSVVAGTASIDQTQALQTIINQASQKAVINWTDFNISPNELVQFIQAGGANAVTLNKVFGSQVSNIQGALEANGNVFLINPNGIVFGANARIDVAGLLATTLNIDNDSFMNGNSFSFAQEASKDLAKVSVQQGAEITLNRDGFVYLIAPQVDNAGNITGYGAANVGRVTLAAGNTFNVDLTNNQLVNFAVSGEQLSAVTDTNQLGVSNSGEIKATNVLLAGNAASELMSSVVNNSGVIEATTLDISGAKIEQDGEVTATTATLAATDNITTGSNSSTRANTLNLSVTADGASVGAEGVALRVDADVLNASASNGHVIVTDVDGGVALGEITTGITDASVQNRAIITAQNGSITSADTSKSNVAAWSANLVSDGSVGAAGAAIQTEVDVLTASTQDGGIYVQDRDGSLIVGDVTVREKVTVSGVTSSVTALSDSSGNIRLSNGAIGSKDIVIGAQDSLIVSGNVTATKDLTLSSQEGSVLNAGSGNQIIGQTISLDAAGGGVGTNGAAFSLQSETVNAAAADGGVYLTENNGLTIGTISASGSDSNVSVGVTSGNLNLGQISADGDVALTVSAGTVTDNNASANNVTADALSITSQGAIGTAANGLELTVDRLTAVTKAVQAGVFASNSKALDALSVTTPNGDVNVDFTGGQLLFNRNTGSLSLTSAQALALNFRNTAGNLILNGVNAGAQGSVVLDASSAITQGSGNLVAGDAKLLASGNIGSADTALRTQAGSLDLTSKQGIVNVANSGGSQLTLSAQANGTTGAVTVQHDGDLQVDSVIAKNGVQLTTTGAITQADDAVGAAVSAASVNLSGSAIGSDQKAFATSVAGNVELNASTGDINYSNAGTVTRLDATAAGKMTIANAGDVGVGTLQAGQSISFAISGNATDANGTGVNFTATGLNASAKGFGSSSDALEINVDTLYVNTLNGGIYARQADGRTLTLVAAKSGGSGSHIDIATAGNMGLGVVSAGGNNVTLAAGGSIEDARADGDSSANVTARSLDISAPGGIGINGDLDLDVSFLSAAGGEHGVSASNAGAIAVDSATLSGKGASKITIIATSITILNNNGGITTMDSGGELTLTATDGNIVFLNRNDTIYLPGGGSITLTALSKSALDGYSGVIIVGNLRTDGGDIKLQAESNITIGMLDTSGNGGLGDVSVLSRNGVILDGNGTAQNIVGDHVTLEASTPSLSTAELTRETAISEYAAKQAELAAKLLQLQILQQQLESYEALVTSASIQQQLADLNQRIAAASARAQQATVDDLSATFDTLNTVLAAATVVRNAAAVIAGAAQAIPFSGDAGADAAFAVVDLAMSAAELAVSEFENAILSPAEDTLAELYNTFDRADAALTDAATNLATVTVIRDTTQTSKEMADLAVFKATVARDASEQVRQQAISAYQLNKDIDSSAEKPLGISSNTLDVNKGGTLNTDLYLDSTGNLGLGDISVADGKKIVASATGNVSVIGSVVSDTFIGLTAGSAILGGGGTLFSPDMLLVAGNGIGENDTLNTQTDRLAANAGSGGVDITNRNAGALLSISQQGAVKGITAARDISVDTDGSLSIDQLIQGSSGVHAVNLTSGGAIIDGNDAARNVQGGTLNVVAENAIELDTEVSELNAQVVGNGDITVREASDLYVNTVSTPDGNVDIAAEGSMTVGSISASSLSDHGLHLSNLTAPLSKGNVTLTAQGNIDDDQDNSTLIEADRLSLQATGSVGANGAVATRALDLSINTVAVAASGEVNLSEADDLHVESIDTDHGNVTVSSAAGSLNIGTLETRGTGATVTLIADQRIDNASLDGSSNVNASNLAMIAGSGVGTNGALNIQAHRLEASGGTGGIDVLDLADGLIIGGTTTNLDLDAISGLQASGGNIRVRATGGNLTVEETVNNAANTGSIDLIADQLVTLDAVVSGQADIGVDAGTSVAQNADIRTANGAVAVNAGGDIVMADVTTQVTGAGSIAYNAGGNVVADRLDVVSGSVVVGAEEGDVSLNDVVSASGNVTVGAGADVAQNADIRTANGAVAVNAGGDIDMLAGIATEVSTAGDVSYTAGGNVLVSEIATADGDVHLTATEGTINVTGNAAQNVQANGLFATAANGIGQLLKAVLTKVDTLVAEVTGSGSIHVNEADALRIDKAKADGLVAITAAGNIEAHGVQAGTASLLSADGTLTTTSDGAIIAGELLASARQGIDVRTQVGSVEAAVTGNGDLRIDEADGIQLTSLTTANGDIDVSAGGDIAVDRVVASAGQDDVSLSSAGAIVAQRGAVVADETIRANNVVLNAAQGIGSGTQGALSLDVNHIDALTTSGNLVLVQSNEVVLDSVVAQSGNVDVSVLNGDVTLGDVTASGSATLAATNGALLDDGDSTSRVSASNLVLDAASGIGGTDGLQTAAGSLVATVRQTGDVVINELNGLSNLSVTAADGDVRVTSASGNIGVNTIQAGGHQVTLNAATGAVHDALNNNANNITAARLSVSGATGVGQSSNALEVTVDSLQAAGGSGGVYIRNLGTGPLTLENADNQSAALLASGGNIQLTTAGDLNVVGDVVNTGGAAMLTATGDIDQDGDIKARDKVALQSGGAITMGDGTLTSSSNGDVSYAAQEQIAVSQIETRTGVGGGIVTFVAPTILDNMPGVANVKAWVIDLGGTSSSTALAQELVGEMAESALVRLNYRVIGGSLAESRRFMDQLLTPVPMQRTSAALLADMAGPPQQLVTPTRSFMEDKDGNLIYGK